MYQKVKVSDQNSPASRADRRRAPRLDVLGQLHARALATPTPVAVRELSIGGFSIEATVPFSRGSVHQFHLSMEGGLAVDVLAVAVHCTQVNNAGRLSLHVSGFEFLQPDRMTTQIIATLVDQVASLWCDDPESS